jgi:hypothetical protein
MLGGWDFLVDEAIGDGGPTPARRWARSPACKGGGLGFRAGVAAASDTCMSVSATEMVARCSQRALCLLAALALSVLCALAATGGSVHESAAWPGWMGAQRTSR